MEPIQKKAKLTGHFRVALKPQDFNVQRNVKKLKSEHDFGKENIVEIITISDDDDDPDDPDADPDDTHDENNHNHDDAAHHDKAQHKNAGAHRKSKAGNENLKPPATTTNNNHNHHTKPPKPQPPPTTTNNNNNNKPKQQTQPQPKPQPLHNKYMRPTGLGPNVVDHDRLLLDDIHCEPFYAWDSYQYDRQQELKFRSRKYLNDDIHEHKITPQIRARLVDWLVQLQDLFSLYHETLYMAIKIADQYLMRKTCSKHQLQLLYMTAILISAKFDERLPPLEISDLLQQAGSVYTRKQLISFEVDILSTLKFNIRFPLSYGFLRRYARCIRSDQKTLTLARYILESSLLEYEMIEILESELAAASLLLALKMIHHTSQQQSATEAALCWNETAVFYTRYHQQDLYKTLAQLNTIISKPLDRKISTIRNKYSHEVFMKVAKIAPLAADSCLLIATSSTGLPTPTPAKPLRAFGKRIINQTNC